MDLNGIRLGIIGIINEVINYLLRGNTGSKIIGIGASGDVTKEFDKVSEDIIVKGIRSIFNDNVLIVSEELGAKMYGSGKWVVIIDPVDGSTNYDSGIPWVSISIGIAKYNESGTKVKDEVLAIVADVFRRTIYEYYNGEVFIDGVKAFRLRQPKNVVFGYFEKPEAYGIIPAYWKVRGSKVALRSLGSVALEMIYLGLGKAEALVDLRAKIRNVDIAAAYRIAHTLGARAALCDGSPLENFPIDDLLNVKCLLAGYDDNVLNKLINAYNLFKKVSH